MFDWLLRAVGVRRRVGALLRQDNTGFLLNEGGGHILLER